MATAPASGPTASSATATGQPSPVLDDGHELDADDGEQEAERGLQGERGAHVVAGHDRAEDRRRTAPSRRSPTAPQTMRAAPPSPTASAPKVSAASRQHVPLTTIAAGGGAGPTDPVAEAARPHAPGQPQHARARRSRARPPARPRGSSPAARRLGRDEQRQPHPHARRAPTCGRGSRARRAGSSRSRSTCRAARGSSAVGGRARAGPRGRRWSTRAASSGQDAGRHEQRLAPGVAQQPPTPAAAACCRP